MYNVQEITSEITEVTLWLEMDITRCVCVYAPTVDMKITIGDFEDVLKRRWKFELTLNEFGQLEVSLILLNTASVELNVYLYIDRACVLDCLLMLYSNEKQYLHSTDLKTFTINLRTEYVSSPNAIRVADFTIHTPRKQCFYQMKLFMEEKGVNVSHWTRIVHSGYGRETLLSLFRKENFHIVHSGSKCQGFYIFVDGTSTLAEIEEAIQKYVCVTRRLTSFSEMRRSNKCRCQIKETIRCLI